MQIMTPEISELIQYADIAERTGLPPVEGGSMDQTKAFLSAASIIKSERAVWRAELMGDG